MEQWTMDEFLLQLASERPVPGGGGASSLAGALGAALGHMAASLTVGKKKYAAHEKTIRQHMETLHKLRRALTIGMTKDADAFLELRNAYALPCGTDVEKAFRRDAVQRALSLAIEPPLEVMTMCQSTVGTLSELFPITSPLVLSDLGCAASLCRACVEAALLNVLINTSAMEDKAKATEISQGARHQCRLSIEACEKLYEAVKQAICNAN